MRAYEETRRACIFTCLIATLFPISFCHISSHLFSFGIQMDAGVGWFSGLVTIAGVQNIELKIHTKSCLDQFQNFIKSPIPYNVRYLSSYHAINENQWIISRQNDTKKRRLQFPRSSHRPTATLYALFAEQSEENMERDYSRNFFSLSLTLATPWKWHDSVDTFTT
jgi:hypothetical protein